MQSIPTICSSRCSVTAAVTVCHLAHECCAEVQTQLEADETCDPMTRSCQVRARAVGRLLVPGCS